VHSLQSSIAAGVPSRIAFEISRRWLQLGNALPSDTASECPGLGSWLL
jgi:hypothetical protein